MAMGETCAGRCTGWPPVAAPPKPLNIQRRHPERGELPVEGGHRIVERGKRSLPHLLPEPAAFGKISCLRHTTQSFGNIAMKPS